jgi:hypothetical protein
MYCLHFHGPSVSTANEAVFACCLLISFTNNPEDGDSTFLLNVSITFTRLHGITGDIILHFQILVLICIIFLHFRSGNLSVLLFLLAYDTVYPVCLVQGYFMT